MSELPRGWEWAALADLVVVEPRAMTDGPFGSNLKSSHYVESGPRVIRLQNIGFGDFIDEPAHITERHFDALRMHEVRAGDLVVASLGQDLPRSCLVPENLGPAIVKADCIRARLHREVNARFVNYALQRPELRHAVADQIHGVGRPRLGMAGIKALRVPLAPRSEQERIVGAIEEHLSRLDAAVDGCAVAMQRANLLMGQMIDGTMTRSSGSVPLSACAASDGITDGPFGSKLKSSHYTDAGPRVIRLENIGRGQFIDLATHISPDYFEDLRKHEVRAGDLVVASLVGDRVRACVVPASIGPAIVKADCIRVRLRPDMDPRFFAYALMRSSLDAYVAERVRGVGRSRLGLRNVAQIPVPDVAPDVQRAISDELDEGLTAVLRARSGVAKVVANAPALRRSILAAAFAGRLVPQDPDDEPASVLLERIRAERAATPPTTRRRAVIV